jgi:hypothetical protein
LRVYLRLQNALPKSPMARKLLGPKGKSAWKIDGKSTGGVKDVRSGEVGGRSLENAMKTVSCCMGT